MRNLLDVQLLSLVLITSLVALACAVIGSALIGIGYARQGRKALTGGLLGAGIGAAIGLLLMGAFGVAASNYSGNVNSRLISIASIGLGLLLLVLLKVFGPQPEKKANDALKELSLSSISQLANLVHTASQSPQSAPSSAKRPHPGHTSFNIFISYRRDDSPDVTGRIYDVLVRHYGKPAVFKDVDSIPFGVDFRQHLSDMVQQCNVVLIVIGDRWLSIADATGHRRLEEQADFVRIEVEAALQRSIRIVPLLVKGAMMPTEDELPPSIKELAYRNGVSIRYDPDFHHDMIRLMRSLDQQS